MNLCYLVFGVGSTIKRVIKVPNRANDTVCQHVFCNDDFEKVQISMRVHGFKHVGLLHTHPISDAILGTGDIDGNRRGSLIFIYSDMTTNLRAYQITKVGKGFVEKVVLIR